jgi:hypothetical protein
MRKQRLIITINKKILEIYKFNQTYTFGWFMFYYGTCMSQHGALFLLFCIS